MILPMAKPSMEVNISFRVRRDLRDAAQEKAKERQENVSDVLREALERYAEPSNTNQQGESQ